MKETRTTVKIPLEARRWLKYASAVHLMTQQDLLAFAAELLANTPEGALEDLRRCAELLNGSPEAVEDFRDELARRLGKA